MATVAGSRTNSGSSDRGSDGAGGFQAGRFVAACQVIAQGADGMGENNACFHDVDCINLQIRCPALAGGLACDTIGNRFA